MKAREISHGGTGVEAWEDRADDPEKIKDHQEGFRRWPPGPLFADPLVLKAGMVVVHKLRDRDHPVAGGF